MEFKKLKPHLFYIFLILFFALVATYPFLNPNNSFHSGDWTLSHQPMVVIMQQALREGTIPLWTETQDAGMPYFAIPDKPFLYLPLLFMILFVSPVAALNSSIVLHVFLAGLFMYILVNYLSKNKPASLISAIIFMINFMVIKAPPSWQFSKFPDNTALLSTDSYSG